MRDLVERLLALQIRRPWLPIAAVAAVTVAAALCAARLELRTRYDALLPDSQPSVRELRRIEQRVEAGQTALILLEGDDRATLRALGDALVPALAALGPAVVSHVEDGPHEARAFLLPRAGLFLDRAELERLRRDVDARWEYEVARETGLLLDEDQGAPPPLTAAALRRRIEGGAGGGPPADRYPGGYFERADGRALVVVVRSPVAGGDLARGGAAQGRIEATVRATQGATPRFAGVRISYAGDLPTGLLEYQRIVDDLVHVGATGLLLVLLVVLLYFLRLRAALVMAITIAVGLTWTFGLTYLVIGHLNVATAFLISIVGGNGINVGILYQARYFEERGRGAPPAEAIGAAVRATWQPTVIAAVAAAASYSSLLVTDFRAFRDFGFIAASGMLLCWLVKTLLVPPLLLLLERWPRPRERPRWLLRLEMGYGRPFSWLVPRAPALFLAAGLAAALGGAASGIRYARSDPMEYDLRRTTSDPQGTEGLQRAWTVCNAILGASQGAMVMVADSADEARELAGLLAARHRAAPEAAKPFVAVHSLFDLVPGDQEAKLPTLRALGERLRRAHDRGLIDEPDWTELAELLPPEGLAPFGIADLPAAVAAPFTDRAGVRGALVFLEAEPDTSNDLRHLTRYADAYREVRLASGKVLHGSGSAVIFADMLRAVVRDVPRAVGLSLLVTLAVVAITFRSGPHLWSVLLALAVGVGGVAIFLERGGVRLNFLNFAALPITFGIGVDYAINVAQRHRADGARDILAALRTSGGAVVLCSLTTMVGYFALMASRNQAIRSLGTIAGVGEICCLLAAVLVLPSLWRLVEGRRAAAPSPRYRSTKGSAPGSRARQ